MIGPLANGLSFVRNFAGPCLWVAVAGFLAGSALGGWGGYKFASAGKARAEAQLAEYRASVATQTAAAVNRARELEQASAIAEAARQRAIVAALNAGDARITQSMESLRRELRSSLAAPEWACLRNPLPDDVSGLFQRP